MKTRKQFKDSGITDNGSFEAIEIDGKPAFLLKENQDFRIVESVQIGGVTFYPKERGQVPYEPYGAHQGSVPSTEELFERNVRMLARFVVIEPAWIFVLALCILLSYCQEKFQTVPYIGVIGDNESGKTTVFQLLFRLCYRPMFGVSFPAADVFTFLRESDSPPTILEDEIQGIERDTEKIKIYKSGYKQGATVPRILITPNDRKIIFHKTFCIKFFASEKVPRVKGFRERLIEIHMTPGIPEKEWVDATKSDFDELKDLRNALLKWRMAIRTQEFPDVVLKITGRMKELWKPLLQIAHSMSAIPLFDPLLKFVEKQGDVRLLNRQETLEGHLVKVVVNILNRLQDPTTPIRFMVIWEDLGKDLDAKPDPRRPHDMNTEEFGRIYKKKISYRLREVLCGKSATIREKDPFGNDLIAKAYTFDIDKVRLVAKKYGYDLVTKLPTSPSSGGAQTP